MARQESDREDLWAEAIALTSRIELADAGPFAPVLIGYRDNGWLSFYFGQDVMLQFTSEGELRRAYRNGELFRTQGDRLSRLRRSRPPEETALLRYDLSPSELADFQSWVHAALRELKTAISHNRARVLREVNAGSAPLLSRIQESLDQILAAERFLAPAITRRASM
jgi:hypothetical protein